MSSVPFVSNEVPIVPSESFLELFVSFCAQQHKLRYETIKLYLSAVRHKYIAVGHGDVFLNMPRLKLTLRGIRKVHAQPKRHRIPLTAPMLYKLGTLLTGQGVLGPDEDALLWATLCVGFFGALRCGEFTDGNLLVNDIVFIQENSSVERKYVSLTVRGSKTDPFRQGCNIFLFATNQLLCPYKALLMYFNRCVLGKMSKASPLFCHKNGDVMTRSSFLHNLHVALEVANLPVDGVSGHSLRKGLATTAAGAKIEDSMISVLGRWASDCYKLYISTPLASIAEAQQTIAQQIK